MLAAQSSPLVLVGDRDCAISVSVGQALDLLHRCQSQAQAVTHITRLRLDADTYEPAARRRTGQNGRPPRKGPRLPTPKSPIAPSRSVLGRRSGGLLRRHHSHGGTHLAYRGVVSRGQAARAPAPGTGPGPPRGIRHTGFAAHRPGRGPGADPGTVCAAPATGGSPFSGCGLTWAWRPKASERTEPLPVQRQPSWGSSPGSPWRLTCWGNSDPRPIAQHLVRQAVVDLRGCRGPGAPPPVAGVGGFSPSAADPDIRRVPVALYHRLIDALAHAV